MTDLPPFEVLTDGALKVMALSWPEEERTAPAGESLAIPVMERQGGVLFCIPCGYLSLSALDAGQAAVVDAVMGPPFRPPFRSAPPDEQGLEVRLELEHAVLIVDFSVAVLPLLRDMGDEITGGRPVPSCLAPARCHASGRRVASRCQELGSGTALDRRLFVQPRKHQAAPAAARPKGKKAAQAKKSWQGKARKHGKADGGRCACDFASARSSMPGSPAAFLALSRARASD